MWNATYTRSKAFSRLNPSRCLCHLSFQVGVQIACSSWKTSHCKSNGREPASKEQADGSEATAAWRPELSSSAAPQVDVAEWDKLEGEDLFRKFSSLLAIRYPL